MCTYFMMTKNNQMLLKFPDICPLVEGTSGKGLNQETDPTGIDPKAAGREAEILSS